MQLFNLHAELRENIMYPKRAGMENKIVYYAQCPQQLRFSK